MKRIFYWSVAVATTALITVLGLGTVPRTHANGVSPLAPAACGPMDVAFVFDTTGSMGGALSNVQAAAPTLISDVSAASGGDFQLSLVTFKDDVLVNNDLASGNTASVSANIASLTPFGGNGNAEASDESLNTVINGLDAADRLPGQQTGDFNGAFRAGAVKIIVLVTDAPPGGFDDTYTVGVDDVNAHLRATQALAKGIKISAVFVPTSGDYDGQAAIMADYASTTGGSFVTTAADGTGTDQAISDIIAGCGRRECSESPISPSEVEAVLFPGQSTEIEKCVEVPQIPAQPDIYFLADTTGSMFGAIGNVQANAAGVLALITAASPDAQFGAGDYKDFPYDVYAFHNGAGVAVDDGIGGNPDASDAIAAWVADGGYDSSEAQLYALHEIATNSAIGYRSGASKFVAWFGDCPGHDPIPTAATGLGSDLTEASVTSELVSAGIKVVAVSLTTGCADGLDGDPSTMGGDYATAYGIVEDGSAGQASRIAAATGGAVLAGVGPDEVATAILTALGSVSVEVTMESTCTSPITTTFTPASRTVTAGSPATFIEKIAVAATAPGGTYACDDTVKLDGVTMLDDTGAPVLEHKTIKVPEGFLTGGGQIATGKGPNANKISFGGNVGFLADFSLVGQWQTNFHNVSGTAFDKGQFHSTQITSLQFYKDAGAGPGVPPANANVGSFTAIGRFNNEPDWTLKVCLADRGEGKNKTDSIRIQLYRPDSSLAYDSVSDFPSQDNTLTGACANRTKLNSGNFQIHSGIKN